MYGVCVCVCVCRLGVFAIGNWLFTGILFHNFSNSCRVGLMIVNTANSCLSENAFVSPLKLTKWLFFMEVDSGLKDFSLIWKYDSTLLACTFFRSVEFLMSLLLYWRVYFSLDILSRLHLLLVLLTLIEMCLRLFLVIYFVWCHLGLLNLLKYLAPDTGEVLRRFLLHTSFLSFLCSHFEIHIIWRLYLLLLSTNNPTFSSNHS